MRNWCEGCVGSRRGQLLGQSHPYFLLEAHLKEIRSVSIAFEKPAPFASFFAPYPHWLNRRKLNVRVADAKEVGVGNPAEETYCYPNMVNLPLDA